MAYKALYRQYRPRRFSDVKDQPAVSEIIKNQVKCGTPSHAYIFAGPRGTGKTSTAKILACALNCLAPEEGEPCLKCENCLAALNDTMPDIIEMDAASNTGVDDARALREKINLLPVSGKYKIYIIDEVHMLSNSAFNALLKTIEEPPDYAVFILATTELRKLPKTVLSRCQRFDFKAIGMPGIKERLTEVLEDTGRTAENEALDMIAQAADGGMRDALTILEKVCSTEGRVTVASVAAILNYAETGQIEQLAGYLAEYQEKAALELLLSILDSGIEPATVVSQLILYFRELLIASVTGEGKCAQAAEKWPRAGIIRSLDILSDTESRMRLSSKPHILLEAAVLKLLLPERQEQPEDSALRIDKLEKKIAALKVAPPAPTAPQKPAASKSAAAPKSSAAAKSSVPLPEGSAEDIWQKLLAHIKSKDMAMYARLRGITAAGMEGSRLTLTSETPSRIALFEAGSAAKELSDAAEELFGSRLSFDTAVVDKGIPGIPDDVEIID